jgi:hypothetical protein
MVVYRTVPDRPKRGLTTRDDRLLQRTRAEPAETAPGQPIRLQSVQAADRSHRNSITEEATSLRFILVHDDCSPRTAGRPGLFS